MTVKLSPLAGAGWQFFDNNGVPLAGGLLYQYQAGTTTPLATYTTAAGSIQNANPIVLNAFGRLSNEIWQTSGSNYKFVLKDSAGALIGTYDDIPGINDVTDGSIALAADLANTSNIAKGDALIGYRQSNSAGLLPNSIGQTVHRKLQETVSVFDFMTQAQIDSVQAGSYSLDVTTPCQNALNSGATRVVFPPGNYAITGLGINTTTSATVRDIVGEGIVNLRLTAAASASCFEIATTRAFVNFDNFNLISTGTKTDGLYTYGILFVGSNAYTTAKNIRAENFSGAGMEWRQTVYTGIENYTCNGCFYGLSFQLYGGIQCTTVTVDRAYITGCTRGLTQTGAVAMEYRDVITEYCGSTTTNDGAFHIAGGQCQLIYPYGEANYRDWVLIEAQALILGQYVFTATAPNIVSWSGTSFDQRGFVTALPYRINTPRLGPDELGSYDLTVGTNLVARLAGGSVEFGNTTTSVTSGTVTSATWTTIYTFTDISGTNNVKASYLYTVYIGLADLSGGFDTGSIFNSAAYSASGTLPAWLRMSGNNLQINITAVSYGLNYKLVLIRTFPGV